MKINYWGGELYVELQDKNETDITINNDGKVTIEIDGDYHGRTYCYTDVCELVGFIELWKEVCQK